PTTRKSKSCGEDDMPLSMSTTQRKRETQVASMRAMLLPGSEPRGSARSAHHHSPDSLVGPLDAGEHDARGFARKWIRRVVGERRVVSTSQLVLWSCFEHLDERGRIELAARYLALLGQPLGTPKHVVRDRDRRLHGLALARFVSG